MLPDNILEVLLEKIINNWRKVIKYGYRIPKVAEDVQKAVLEEVSKLSGLKVVEVNVYIQNIKVEEVTEEETTEEYED